MTIIKADKGKAVDQRQSQRWSDSTLVDVDNEDGVDVGGGGTGGSSFSNGSSSETKLSHIYDGHAGDVEDNGRQEGHLSRRALSEVLPYNMNLSGSTLVSQMSRNRPFSTPPSSDAKKEFYRNGIQSGGGMNPEETRRKPQWLEPALAPLHAFYDAVCGPKEEREKRRRRKKRKKKKKPADEMKKFGFGKKSDGDDVSVKSSSSGLFGRKKDSSQDDNPYAQNTSSPDPYAAPMTPYQQARSGLPSGPRAGAPNGLPSGPGPRGSNGPPPPYSSTGASSSGYGAEKFGASGGYGSNRYDDNASAYSANSSMSSRGPGGYGGLGRTDTMNEDDNRGALFAGAQDRYQPPRQGQSQNDGRYGQYDNNVAGPSSAGARYGDDANKAQLFGGAGDRYAQQPRRDHGHASSSNDESYDGYGAPRELTEEEQEEQDVQNIKQEIRDIRQDSKATTGRTLAILNQTREQARGTYARLGAQGERLHNTEKNLDLASNYNKVAEDRTAELKTLNRSMFAVHVSNPFTAKERKATRDAEVLDRHRMEREQRQATRQDAFAANQRMEQTFKDLNQPKQLGSSSALKTGGGKFEFYDNDDDELIKQDRAFEAGIDEDLGYIGEGVGELHQIAQAMNNELDRQNQHIDRIAMKSDAVDDGVRMNREKLNRIR